VLSIPAVSAARGRLAAIAGPLLLLAVFLPLRLVRAAIENSLWVDETASLMLASHPVSVILDQCAVDTNPPGYFLALKAWLKLGKLFLSEPGVLWARALGTAAWLALVAGVAWVGRSLAPGAVNLLLAAVAGSAYAAVSANDARGYCLATVALCLSLLLMLDLYAHPERPLRQAAVRWLLFTLSTVVALWSHLLSAPIFLMLGALFVVLAWRRRTPQFAVGGALALALAGLCFVPWSLAVLAGIGSLQASAVTWMTPATVPNLLAVFYYWYPFGRIAGPGQPWLDGLGAASILVPVVAALVAARRCRGDANPILLILAAAGLAVAVGFVILLWLLQRFGVVTVFHAPRYPALTAAFWAAGLAALAAWTVERARLRRPAAWLLLAPWLLAAVAGQIWAVVAEKRGGLREMRARFAPYLSPGSPGPPGPPAPPAGTELYAMPSELIPFFRQTFADVRLRPIAALPCDLPRRDTAAVLELNFWHFLDRPRDLIARRLLETGHLAARQETAVFPDWRRDYAIHRLTGVDRAAAEALCRRGLGPAPRPVPPGAAAVALPEDQEYHRGWSFPEVAPDLSIRRWASRETSEIRFDREVRPGSYVLHIRGYNPAYPAAPASIAISVPGESGGAALDVAEGELAADVQLHLTKAHAPLIVSLKRPTWSPRRATGASDSRVLAWLLEVAWLERQGS
jgi:hypothetical protein